MNRLILLCSLLIFYCFAHSQGVKNVNGKLYCYATSLNSPGVKKTFPSLTPGVEYTISVWIWDSIGTNTYTLTVMNESETSTLGAVTVKRSTPTLTFKMPAGTKDVHFYISSSNSTTGPLPAHNFYIDDLSVSYIGTVTVQEPVDNYRFGYNGHEKDNEVRGDHNQYGFGDYGYDPRLARRANVDPKAKQYPGQSPYSATNNSPVQYNDPTGQSGEVTIDKEAKTLTITSHFVFYGGAASTLLASTTARDIQDKWNEAQGKVMIDGITYKVQFVITGEYKPDLTPSEVMWNKDIKNNYIRVEEKTNAEHEGSYMTGTNDKDASSNSGYWKLAEIQGQASTTEAHEAGHGYGLPEADLDLRGQGQPGIMAAKGTAVDAPYTYDPSLGATKGTPRSNAMNTINPGTRKVTQKDINKLGLNKIIFNSVGKGQLGKITNIFFR